jgi:hypothetical protein
VIVSLRNLVRASVALLAAWSLVGCDGGGNTDPLDGVPTDVGAIVRVWTQKNQEGAQTGEFSFDAANHLGKLALPVTEATAKGLATGIGLKNVTVDMQAPTAMLSAGVVTLVAKITGTQNGKSGSLDLNYKLVGGLLTVNAERNATLVYHLTIILEDSETKTDILKSEVLVTEKGDLDSAGTGIDYETFKVQEQDTVAVVADDGSVSYQTKSPPDSTGTTTATWDIKTGDPLPAPSPAS